MWFYYWKGWTSQIYGIIVDIAAGLKIVALPKLRLAYNTHYTVCISRVFFLEILVITRWRPYSNMKYAGKYYSTHMKHGLGEIVKNCPLKKPAIW